MPCPSMLIAPNERFHAVLKHQNLPVSGQEKRPQSPYRWLISMPSLLSAATVLMANPVQGAEALEPIAQPATHSTASASALDARSPQPSPLPLAKPESLVVTAEPNAPSKPGIALLTTAPAPDAEAVPPKFRATAPQPEQVHRPLAPVAVPSQAGSALPTDWDSAPILATPDTTLAQAIAPSDAPPADAPIALQEGSRGDRWHFSVEPYFFIPLDIDADVTVAGRSASIDAGLGDILDLEEAFDAGIRFEARRRRFGIMLDGFYLVAGESGTLRTTLPAGSLLRFGIPFAVPAEADASATLRQGTIDLSVFYRVVDTSLRNEATAPPAYPRLMFDPILGIRTNIVRQDLEIDEVRIGPQTFDLNREFDFSRTTLEPLLGARLQLRLSRRWSLELRGDVSGFNLNAEQDTTWNLLAGTQYDFSPSVGLQLAYGFSGFTYEDGEGLNRAEIDLEQHGLWLSVLFRF